MLTQESTSTNKSQALSAKYEKGQYTLWHILGIWLVAGAPMWLLGWVAYPALSIGLPPLDAGLLRFKLLTVGLIWEFIWAMIILYREEGNVRPSTISRRFWLNHPVSTRTGKTNKALWWWILPLIVLVASMDLALRPALINLTGTILPALAEPKGYEPTALFSPVLRPQWIGAWGWFGLFFVESLFNTVLGEEFVFRGVLLPKMQGMFGKWDWVANGVIFGFYHLHQPWGIPASILNGLIYALSAKHFRSTWFAIILHSGQSVFFVFLVLGLVLGLA
jgi:membrane protease YdiL (CAAX protease family)